jgi:hypothetical protein
MVWIFMGQTRPSLAHLKKKKIFCNDLCFIGLCPAQYVMVWIFMGQTRPSLAHFKKTKRKFSSKFISKKSVIFLLNLF